MWTGAKDTPEAEADDLVQVVTWYWCYVVVSQG